MKVVLCQNVFVDERVIGPVQVLLETFPIPDRLMQKRTDKLKDKAPYMYKSILIGKQKNGGIKLEEKNDEKRDESELEVKTYGTLVTHLS